MSKALQMVEDEDGEAWDAFVSSSPQRSIFVQRKFLDALQAGYRLVSCRERGEIVAATVIMLDDDGKPVGSVFPFTQYQGVLLGDYSSLPNHSRVAREFKLLEFFLSALVDRFSHVCMCQSWRLQDMRPFQWLNYNVPDGGRFRLELRYTGVLTQQDFGTAEHYLASVRKVRRQEFEKASQSLQLVDGADEKILSELYWRTFARQGIEIPDQEARLMRSVLDHSTTYGFGRMMTALKDGMPVSAVLFLYDDRTAYYLFGANDPQYRKSFGGSLLLLTLVRDAFARGLQEVDFVGVNSPNRADFKLSLNAGLRPYFITSL
jgi:ribosomal protein S18 acetylase RimI-like enzyme